MIRYKYSGSGFDGQACRGPAHDPAFLVGLYRSVLRIRIIEEEIEKRYHEDQMKTPIYLMIGQEATSVGGCTDQNSIVEFGKLPDESLMYKKGLSPAASTQQVDDIYQVVRDAGAIGGKIPSAGGEELFRPSLICYTLSQAGNHPFQR